MASDEFQNELRALRAKEYVDYTGVLKHKLRILRIVFDKAGLHHKSNNTPRSKQFKVFFNEGGDSLQQIAIYDALQQYLYNQGENAWGWPAWEEKFRKYSNPEVMNWAHDHQDDVYFYAYLQFIADEQLAKADWAAKHTGMTLGIYRDLAVGVSEGSAELWANAEELRAAIAASPVGLLVHRTVVVAGLMVLGDEGGRLAGDAVALAFGVPVGVDALVLAHYGIAALDGHRCR